MQKMHYPSIVWKEKWDFRDSMVVHIRVSWARFWRRILRGRLLEYIHEILFLWFTQQGTTLVSYWLSWNYFWEDLRTNGLALGKGHLCKGMHELSPLPIQFYSKSPFIQLSTSLIKIKSEWMSSGLTVSKCTKFTYGGHWHVVYIVHPDYTL